MNGLQPDKVRWNTLKKITALFCSGSLGDDTLFGEKKRSASYISGQLSVTLRGMDR